MALGTEVHALVHSWLRARQEMAQTGTRPLRGEARGGDYTGVWGASEGGSGSVERDRQK